MRSYERKRKRQYFEPTPPAKRSRSKSHSPNFNNVTWDKEKVLSDLQSLPSAPPAINWQMFAREHGIIGSNAGQVAKEFAQQSGVDTARLDGRDTSTQRSRARRRRLIGGEISVGSTPTSSEVKREWINLVETGEISLGQPCVPYNMVRFTIKDGELHRTQVSVVGRKFPLLEIRKELLAKHEKYMRLATDTEIQSMSSDDISLFFNKINHQNKATSLLELQNEAKSLQCTRSIIMWHDHGTILGLGCVIITVHIAYDPAVFYTQSEYEERYTKSISIQTLVERPVIHLIAAGTSAVDDQLALLQDRIDCLYDLSLSINSSNGINVNDKLKFFIGDHPAQQFERGTQLGGNFKCGGCRVRSSMMGDLAHTLQLTWRDLQEQQDLVIKGKFGKQACNSKPFDRLRLADLKQELHSRDIFDTSHRKDDLQDMLTNILCGIQHVPTLLLLNPEQPLSQLNLDDYSVLDCEPLHDLKGHFKNLLQELPFLLNGDKRTTCEEIIKASTGDTMTGAKCRVCLIELFLFLKKIEIDYEILLLIESALRISEILYMHDEHRNARNILRLYNCTWLHHELCVKMISTFHGGTRYTTFFGVYLHALVAHAPRQLEIVSLRSVNTENQERLFEQARRSATAASNRHPQNVLYSAILRLQAKAAFRNGMDTVQQADSIVGRAGANVPAYTGTVLTKEFIKNRERSWQAHLQRISHYLIHGRGTWWKETTEGYKFLDGDSDPKSQPSGPQLRHFRSVTLKEVNTNAVEVWDQLLRDKIELPTTGIVLYNEAGDPTQRLGESTEEADNTTPSGSIVFDITSVAPEEGMCGEESVTRTEETPGDITAIGQKINEQEQSIIEAGETPENQKNGARVERRSEQADELNIGGEVERSDAQRMELKTKNAIEIMKIIGDCDELKQFDELRYHLKSVQQVNQGDKLKYRQLFYKLQLMVQRKKTSLIQQIAVIERTYHREHGKLPSEKDCTDIGILMEKCRHINKLLLQVWKLPNN